MNTVLVTGGAGFIGSQFVREAVRNGESRVVNLDKLTYAGNLDSLASVLSHPNHTFIQADIADRETVERVIREYQPGAIVHFAAESHVDRSIDAPEVFVRTNVLGTFQLLDVACRYWRQLPPVRRDAFRFLHVSTDEVYGSLGAEGRFTESSPYAPNSPYSASKASADHFARAYYHTYGLPVLITNCSNNYGPYQFPEKLIPLMILNAIEGKSLPVYGDGQNVRDWIYVGDHCDALWRVIESGQPGETFNIGADCQRSNLAVVREVCAAIDALIPELPHAPCASLIRFVQDRPGHDRRYAIDGTKIRDHLGWRPQHDFASGLRETVQWYLENPQWVHRVTTSKYRRERLGVVPSLQEALV